MNMILSNLFFENVLATLKKAIFKAFLLIPGSRYVFRVIKRVFLPSRRWRKYFRFKGVFKVDMGGGVQLKMMNYGNTIENELFWLGSKGWEGHATLAWRKLSEQSSVIFDVGANTGLYSLVSAKVNPSALIYAFEPMELIFERFRKNLKLNNLHVQAFSVALSDVEGEGKIFVAKTISDTFDQASLSAANYKERETNVFLIRMRKLSSFIEEHEIRQIDLMKVDVETFEPQVLRGMGSYLTLFAPTLLIEILNEDVSCEVENLLRGLDYEYYLIDEKSGFHAKSNLLPDKRGNNFLLLSRLRHPKFQVPFSPKCSD